MLALTSLLALATGCTGSAGAPAVGPTAGAETTTDELCPADLPGLAARSAGIRGGGALVLTTNREHVYELRHRMRRFAEEHRDAAGERARTALERGETAEDAAVIDASMVRVVEVPRGARLEVRPRNVERVGALRSELRSDARDLSAGVCPLALTIGR